jgi:hypothetical protein
MPSIASFLNLQIPREDAMEVDGISFTGKLAATDPQVTLAGNKLLVKWKKGNVKGDAKIWLATTNNYKSGGEDAYSLVATVPLAKENATIDLKGEPSPFYKVVIETPVNFLNRWVITQK